MDRMVYYMQNLAAPCALPDGGLFLPTWYKYIEGDIDSLGKCSLNANMPDDIGRILLGVIEIMLRVGGIAAVAFVVYGGFRYITSQGEPEQTKSARQTITNALIGLMLSITATGIVAFIGSRFG